MSHVFHQLYYHFAWATHLKGATSFSVNKEIQPSSNCIGKKVMVF